MNTTHPLFARPPTKTEREALEVALRASDAFVLRRAQIILASAQGERVGLIAPRVGFSRQAVRDVIHAFNAQGAAVLQRGTTHNKVYYYSFDTASAEALRDLLHHSPRDAGQDTSVWTLELAAEVAYARGLTAWQVSGETVRATLARMGVRTAAGQGVDHQPRPGVRAKKSVARSADPAGESGTLTGCWASRTRSGGAGWPVRPCTRGETTPIRCA
jgi:transposase